MPGKQNGEGLPHTNLGLESNVSKLFQNGISHPQLTAEAVLHFPTDSSISFNIWTAKTISWYKSYVIRKLTTTTAKSSSTSKYGKPDEKDTVHSNPLCVDFPCVCTRNLGRYDKELNLRSTDNSHS